MVKLGPDLYTGSDSYSGYQPKGNFTGFTMLHESGTGGAPKYGVVSQMPVVGKVTNPLSDAMNDTRAATDVTKVGYYKASLGSGTVLEMSASTKAGIYHYTFPKKDELNILVDVSHVLSSYRGQGLEQHYINGSINVHKEDGSNIYYTGSGTYDNVSTLTFFFSIFLIYLFKGNRYVCGASEPITNVHIRVGTEPVRGQSISVAGLTLRQPTRHSSARTKIQTSWQNSPIRQATRLQRHASEPFSRSIRRTLYPA